MRQVHPQARTTPLIRAEIKAATGSQGELAARHNISVATLRKWQNRDQAQDRSHRPQMPDATQRRHLFVAIARATRWVFIRIHDHQSEVSSCDFLWQVHQAAPMKITKLVTDNGSQFRDRFTSKGKEPSGGHKFDKRCVGLGTERRLIAPRHPQTNGRVKRFNPRISGRINGRINGRVSEVPRQTRFKSGAELAATLTRYARAYNHRAPQRALDHRTPNKIPRPKGRGI